MSEVVLVTGSETLTGRKLIEKLLARGSTVVAPIAGRETEKNETGSPDLCVLTWNRSSWFSAKTVVRETLRLNGRIDAAWLLHQRRPATTPFAEAASGDVEEILEHGVKGGVALARELMPVLAAAGGFLGLVIPRSGGGDPGSLEALEDGAFAGFAASLVREVPPSLWSCGFACTSPDAEGFTDAVLDMYDRRPAKLRGRWFRYTEGRRPFGGPLFADAPA